MRESSYRRLEGSARVQGREPVPWSIDAGADGEFRWCVRGDWGERIVFDGLIARARDWAGADYPCEMFDLAVWRAVSSTVAEPRLSGTSLAAMTSPLPLKVERDAQGRVARLSYPAPTGSDVWRFDWSEGGLPLGIVKTVSGHESLAIEVQGSWENHPGTIALDPVRHPDDFRMDPAVPVAVPVTRGPYGHVLVPARVDAEAPAWFILDSGASNNTLQPEFATEAGLRADGGGTVVSIAGPEETTCYRASTLTVGPLVLDDARFVGFDMSPFGDVFGVPVAGVLGFDVFRRTQVRVRPEEPVVELLPIGMEGTLQHPGMWIGCGFSMRHPIVPARLSGRDAQVRLDLGMGGDMAAILHPGADARLGLDLDLSDEETMIGATPAWASVLDGLELAFVTVDRADILVSAPVPGVFHDPWVDATVGMGILAGVTLVFDYAGARVGFAPGSPAP